MIKSVIRFLDRQPYAWYFFTALALGLVLFHFIRP